MRHCRNTTKTTIKLLDMMISKRDRDNLLKLGYKLNLFGGKTPQEVDSTFSNIRNLHLDLVITLNQYDYD